MEGLPRSLRVAGSFHHVECVAICSAPKQLETAYPPRLWDPQSAEFPPFQGTSKSKSVLYILCRGVQWPPQRSGYW